MELITIIYCLADPISIQQLVRSNQGRGAGRVFKAARSACGRERWFLAPPAVRLRSAADKPELKGNSSYASSNEIG